MSADLSDISILPQRGTWAIVFVPFLATAFASGMLQLEINPFWWAPPLALFTLAMLASQFMKPFEIIFRPAVRTMVVRYRIGRRQKVYRFDELDFIHSYIRVSGEADTYVRLEVCLKNGKHIPVIEEHAAWERSVPCFGLSGAREPEDLSILRGKISSATGLRDLGFCM